CSCAVGPNVVENVLRPMEFVAATAMTPAQFDGVLCWASTRSLPAAATIARVTPWAKADAMTSWYACVQSPYAPSLRLITCAGVELTGTPGTGNPAAHAMPSRMSESSP